MAIQKRLIGLGVITCLCLAALLPKTSHAVTDGISDLGSGTLLPRVGKRGATTVLEPSRESIDEEIVAVSVEKPTWAFSVKGETFRSDPADVNAYTLGVAYGTTEISYQDSDVDPVGLSAIDQRAIRLKHTRDIASGKLSGAVNHVDLDDIHEEWSAKLSYTHFTSSPYFPATIITVGWRDRDPDVGESLEDVTLNASVLRTAPFNSVLLLGYEAGNEISPDGTFTAVLIKEFKARDQLIEVSIGLQEEGNFLASVRAAF